LARVDAQARALEAERSRLQRDRRAADETTAKLQERETALAEREERFARRLNEKLEDRVRQARRDIDQVIEQLKDRAEGLIEQASIRARTTGISTGDAGAARSEAREAVERIINQVREPGSGALAGSGGPSAPPSPAGDLAVGARVSVGLGME